MPAITGRALIESRLGPLGWGGKILTIAGVDYTLAELQLRMGLDFNDSRGIDALALSDGHYVLRYVDGQDQRVVAHEFDADFRFLGEARAHVAEWIGEKAYFSFFSGH
jgi:hypothetical protein